MSTDSSTVKAVLTEEQKQKVAKCYKRQYDFCKNYKPNNYLIIVQCKFLWFTYATETYDWSRLEKDLSVIKGLYSYDWGFDYSPTIHKNKFGESLIRLNKLIKSGNELSLSPDDSNALDYILNNEV